jgi:hypothetical protein
MNNYDGALINRHWNNAWPAEVTAENANSSDHEFSPVLQAPVANLLGEPWYLESGSPGGDYVTWLEVEGGGQVSVSPHPVTVSGEMRWCIGLTDADGQSLAQEHYLPITAPAADVAAAVREFMAKHEVRAAG